MKCPVCGKYTFPDHVSATVCPICQWHDDLFQRKDHNCVTETNHLSINEQRIEFFLLNHKKTSSKAKRLQDRYYKKCSDTEELYPQARRLAKTGLYAEKTAKLDEIRFEYINELNELLLSFFL